MATGINVEAKVIGQKRPVPMWTVPIQDTDSNRLLLRELIAQVVLAEVRAFAERQESRRLLQILTPDEIARGVEKGKVDLGGRDLQQVVEPEAAVDTALQAFDDGLYFVFLDGEQQTALDGEVFLRPDCRMSFVRLTPLAGG